MVDLSFQESLEVEFIDEWREMRGQTGRSPIFHKLCHGSEPHLLTIRGGFLRSARRAIPIAGENDLRAFPAA
jgi:hypothetical protein